MKKITFFLLSVGLFLLIGCGKDPSEPVDPPNVEKPDLTYNVIEDLTSEIKVITLSWESVRAKSCKLNGDSVALIGSKVFEIPEDVTFTFVVIGDGGTTEKKVDVKAITAPTIPLPKIVYFTISEDTLPEGGGGAWLSWKILNAFKDSISINGIAQTDTIGSYYTGFLSNTGNSILQVVYTLTAIGSGGSKTASLTLTVPPIPPPPPLPTAKDTLCLGPWYLIKLEFMTPPSTEWVEYTIFENTLDDFLTFYTNPDIGVYNFGVKKNPGEPQTLSGPWSMEGTVIILGETDIYYIEELNENTLIWTNYSGNSDEQVRRTYAHQPLQ